MTFKLAFISTNHLDNKMAARAETFTCSERTILMLSRCLRCALFYIGVDFNEEGEILTQKGLKICTYQIQELVLGALNQAVANKLLESIDILRESYTGTSTFCELIHGHLLVDQAQDNKLRIGMGFNLVIFVGPYPYAITIILTSSSNNET